MIKKSSLRDLLTLMLALLLGAGASTLTRGGTAGSPDNASPSAGAASDPIRPAVVTLGPSSEATRLPSQAVACASAWESLKDGRFSQRDRITAQRAILDEWADHDLAAALVAYHLESEWWSRGLSINLADRMDANPGTVEKLIKSGRLGLQTNKFRDYWFCHLAESDPVGILDRLHELPNRERSSVLISVASALPSISEDLAIWHAGMDRISSLIDRPIKSEVIQAIAMGLGDGNSLADLNAAYLATADPRLRDLFAGAAKRGSEPEDPFADHSVIPDEVHSLPEPFRSAVIEKWKR